MAERLKLDIDKLKQQINEDKIPVDLIQKLESIDDRENPLSHLLDIVDIFSTYQHNYEALIEKLAEKLIEANTSGFDSGYETSKIHQELGLGEI